MVMTARFGGSPLLTAARFGGEPGTNRVPGSPHTRAGQYRCTLSNSGYELNARRLAVYRGSPLILAVGESLTCFDAGYRNYPPRSKPFLLSTRGARCDGARAFGATILNPIPGAVVQLITVRELQFDLEAFAVGLDGLDADPHLLGDLASTEATSDESQHLQLSVGQWTMLLGGAAILNLPQELSRHAFAKPNPARCHRPQGMEDTGAGLRLANEPVGPRSQRALGVLVFRQPRGNQHPKTGPLRLQRFDEFETIGVTQINVENEQIGFEPVHGRKRLAGCADGSADDEA